MSILRTCYSFASGEQAKLAASKWQERVPSQASGAGAPVICYLSPFVGREEGEGGVSFAWEVGKSSSRAGQERTYCVTLCSGVNDEGTRERIGVWSNTCSGIE